MEETQPKAEKLPGTRAARRAERKPVRTAAAKRKFTLSMMLVVWVVAFLIVASLFIASEVSARGGKPLLDGSTFWLLSIVINFMAFVMTTLFSFVILNHNTTIRELSERALHRDESSDIRSEEFRKLTFVSSNYAVVDFVDNMLLYEEYKTYTNALKTTNDFSFYLREDNITLKDVVENFDNYVFLTVKIPFKIAEGKNVGAIRISRFKFSKEGKDHRFVPCSGGNNTLILFSENDQKQVVTVNLIAKKDNEFYTPDAVIPFIKIKLNLTMYSLLGVAVTGWTELYFTNPRKLEKSGANMYKINSSQFRISGLPTLLNSVGEDIKDTVVNRQ
jgi:hypothetical protein